MKRAAHECGKIEILAGLLLPLGVLLASPGVVLAEDDNDAMGWFIPKDSAAKNVYGGVGVSMDNDDFPDSNQDGSVTGVGNDETGTGKQAFAGYQITDNVAVQGGYRDLGDSDFNGTSSGGPSWSAGPVSASLDANGWELGVLGRWPITDRWYALGYLGWYWWETTETFVEGAFVSEDKNSGGDAAAALGLEYDIGLKDRIVYRFMGEHHRVDDSGYNINSAAAEIVYRFP
ncbi:MAG: outer membrane beta-barrel protein [Gammaproteobacteria bacterium]|nr:outer membrane beta-barrel protein [Gammaproteobacteria bacterium]